MEVKKKKVLEAQITPKCDYRFYSQQDNYTKIPGSPIAYWVSNRFSQNYENKSMSEYAQIITGMTIGDNNLYLRLWYELERRKISIGKKCMDEVDLLTSYWIPYSKGGPRRNWYGNYEYVVNWAEHENFNRSKTTLQYLYLKRAITWPFVTSGAFSARILETGFLWDVAGSPCFFNNSTDESYALGFLCSKVADYILKVVNPTINVQAVDIQKLPLIINTNEMVTVNEISHLCVELSKKDWNSFETSWDFQCHPLVMDRYEYRAQLNAGMHSAERKEFVSKIEKQFEHWKCECDERFDRLKANEEELNRIFIDIYGLQEELTPEVADKDVTVRKADLGRDIRSLISYAVGCMFGRYSLDVPGLAYAGGEWDASKYATYPADRDGILPITDDEYFQDDIVSMFIRWVRVVYGEETLEENLQFIANALNPSGGSAREVIRSYFMNDFYADHLKVYQKRPIYWQFDSGKQNGFKALMYLHRYDQDTVARLRTDYVHELQDRYRTQLDDARKTAETGDARQRAVANKRAQKLDKQLTELNKYEELVHHYADMRIPLDLDDGVKVNYAKLQAILTPIK